MSGSLGGEPKIGEDEEKGTKPLDIDIHLNSVLLATTHAHAHAHSLPIDQLVRTVMTLFQDQPDLLLGFKEFLPEAQGLLNQLVPVSVTGKKKGEHRPVHK